MAIYDPTKRPADGYDTHTHLNADNFWHDPEAYWARAREHRIVEMNVVGYDTEGNERVIKLAHDFEGLHAIVGWQPGDIAGMTEEAFAVLEDQVMNDPEVVGVGEIGLDYHWEENPSPEDQKAAFNKQLDLAKRAGKPVTIHSRDALDDTYDLLKAAGVGEFGGVMHSFTGSAEEALRFVELGMYISFSGMVTFKNAKEIKEALQVVPLDRILVETDAPYLAPTPMRGKENEPMFTRYTIASMAEQLGKSYDEMATITRENAHRLWLNGTN